MKFERLTQFAILCLALAIAGLALHAAEPEDELKSAVVLSFLRYTEWPERGGEGPIIVGVVGRSALLEVFRRNLENKPVGNRPIRVVDLNAAADPHCCNVLYVAAAKPAEIRKALLLPGAVRALTVGESDHFLECGGAVNLLVIDGHMSFEANLEAIDRALIVISSKLLRFGQIRSLNKGGPPA